MKIGVDIGGTHISVGVLENANIIEKIEVNTKDVNVLEFVVTNSNTFMHKYSIEAVGIGYCGIIKNGIIEKSPNLNIDKCNLKDILEQRLKVPVIVRNDAKCAGLAEHKYGAMKEYEDCFLLTIGTGIGGAYFYKGKLVEPKRNSAFEVGHMQIVPNGIRCKCGKKGCFEQYASITALKREVTEKLNVQKNIDGVHLKQLIEQNKDILKDTLDVYIKNLATGISNIVCILEPEIIALGGSFAYYEDIFLDKVINEVNVLNKCAPKIVTAFFKNDAGIIGACIG